MKSKIFTILLVLSISLLIIAAENPHEKIKFDCETCHSVDSFEDMSFDHSLTDYILENRHQSADCRGCHDIADFSKVKENCISCHQDVHKAKMGSDCESCHTTRGWEQFDIQQLHMNTNFPISGRHALVDCQSCHKKMPAEDFSLQTTRCIECHQMEYLSITSPEHANNGFSTDCESCHQMNQWRPARFDNHDVLFPIFSGTHNNEWNDCVTCHVEPGSYQMFSCLNCHEHTQSETDADHNGITGYAYNSPDCYFCHPTGEAGSFTDHDAQFFPIFSGRHNNEWNDCAVCHTTPTDKSVYTCLPCHDHNQTDMNNMHGAMIGYTYASGGCYTCHPTGLKGTFTEHDTQFFPIYSGAHSSRWDNCVDCHPTPLDRTVFSCFQCHQQPQMDDKHSGEIGYAYDSNLCLSCHPNGSKE
ncbi:MAG: hypothetical protein DWP97_09745 [Calditrichaeota bacterium]|nr:MAG: hypothetical protein DWP97_09745 [Calditrichota bacterium]